MMVHGYNVEIDEIDQYHVVLVIRALRLIVLGHTLGEAQRLATAAIASRGARRGCPLQAQVDPGREHERVATGLRISCG